jgi:hypothetical protein
MTSVDLCAMYKSWCIQENIVSAIMDEFWQEVCFFFSNISEREQESDLLLFFVLIWNLFIQGDEEKRRGIQPQSLMDRSLAHELPKNQVFID